MSVRDLVNTKAGLATGGAIALLVVAAAVLAVQLRGPGVSDLAVYYWDLDADEHFIEPAAAPPITAPSGGEGVRANLYSCGECAPDQWFGYLRTYSEAYREAEAAGVFEDPDWSDPQIAQLYHGGRLIRPLEGGDWVPQESRAGEALIHAVRERCAPERPVSCEP